MAETFHAAQRRHRRTARGYGALAAVAALGQAVPAAIMTAPVTLSVAVLVTDVVHLVRPTPEQLVTIDDALAARDLGAVPPLVALWWFAQRFLLRDGLGGVVLSAGGRPPDPRDEEHQLVNVVEELSLAAGIRTPTAVASARYLRARNGSASRPPTRKRFVQTCAKRQLAATPDGIGRALVHLDRAARPLPGAEWAAIYTITSPAPTGSGKPGDGRLEDAVTLPGSLHPALYRRVRRLRRLGFRGWLPAPPRFGRDERFARWSWPMRRLVDLASLAVILFVILPLLLLLAAVAFEGLVVCVELGMLFYAALSLPVALPPHVLLRFLT
jgi:hypothetical protein